MKKGLFFKNVEYHKDNVSVTLNPEIEGFLENREMYNLLGFSDITKEDIGRYIESNKKLYKKLPNIIQENFKKGDWEDRISAAIMIPYTSVLEQSFLRERCLKAFQKYFEDESPFFREKALATIPYIPIEKRTEFVQKSLEDEDRFVCKKGAKMISYTSESEQSFLRKRCLETFQKKFGDKDPLVREGAVVVIPGVSVEKRAGLIRKVYEKEKDIFVIREVIETIPFAPKEERAELIQMFLKDKNPFVRKKAIRMIPSVSEEKMRDLFQEALLDKDLDNRKLAEKIIWRILGGEKVGAKIQTKEREEERKKDPLIQKLAEKSSLYKDDKKFFRKDFPKSHSEITLLDEVPGQPEKSLRQRAIIRHIKLIPYFLWKKVYESHEYWREKGFDYVPIEPIIRVSHRESKINKVDVLTRVLNGPSVATWINNNGPYQLEIEEQIKKIKRGLEEIGVEHGHLYRHKHNFVLVFPKNEDGTVNLSHHPRVYVIDFDMARPKQELGE